MVTSTNGTGTTEFPHSEEWSQNPIQLTERGHAAVLPASQEAKAVELLSPVS
jgi:hypothetical protein